MGLISDCLDEHGASDDHMEVLVEEISIIAARINTSHARPDLEWEIRHGCAGALCNMLQKLSLPMSSWFHAMGLLDIYSHMGGTVDRTQIPATCTAIAIIVGKFEGADTSQIYRFVKDDAAMKKVLQKEIEVLELLQFRVRCPTLCSWLNIFLPRLGIIMSDSAGAQFATAIRQLSMQYGQAFVKNHVCMPHSDLGLVAQGVIGVACVEVAKKFGLAIRRPCELSKHVQGAVLSAIGVDMKTWMSNFHMVSDPLRQDAIAA